MLLIVPEDAPAAALGALVRHRADLGTGVLQYVIPLRAERLAVTKHAVVESEVVVRTDVISEVRTFEVTVEREEFVIERRRFGADGRPGELETTRIPLRHEEVTLTKRTVVTEEVDVRKERFVEVERVGGTVRHEELRVEADPGAPVRYGEGVLRSGRARSDPSRVPDRLELGERQHALQVVVARGEPVVARRARARSGCASRSRPPARPACARPPGRGRSRPAR